MESNTPGTQTKFEDHLVDFDYEIWRKFGLSLYWPADGLSIVWPLKILTERVHPTHQMVGLVKKRLLEEVVVFSKETGKDPTGRCVLMDLDSLYIPVRRANTLRELLSSSLKLIWNIFRLSKTVVWRSLKLRYGHK